MKQSEIAELAKLSKKIAKLNVTEFLKMIEEKAKAWKKDLTNG